MTGPNAACIRFHSQSSTSMLRHYGSQFRVEPSDNTEDRMCPACAGNVKSVFRLIVLSAVQCCMCSWPAYMSLPYPRLCTVATGGIGAPRDLHDSLFFWVSQRESAFYAASGFWLLLDCLG